MQAAPGLSAPCCSCMRCPASSTLRTCRQRFKRGTVVGWCPTMEQWCAGNPFLIPIQPSKVSYTPAGSPLLTTPVPVCSVPAVLWAVPDGSTLAAPGSADCTKQGMTSFVFSLQLQV